MLTETSVPRRALRYAHLLLAPALLCAAAACSKTPDSPGGPGRAAPKATVVLPAPQVLAPETGGVMRIPASPADNAGAATAPRRPSRIWV